jgi:tetratricopeptide (TPR) repeat protein
MKKLVFVMLLLLLAIQIFAETSKVNSLISQLPKEDNEEKAILLMNISEEYKDIDFEKAMQYAQKARKLTLKLQDNDLIALSKKNMGLLYFQKGDFRKATDFFQRALKYFKKIGSKLQIGDIYVNLALINNNMGKYETTLDYYHKALKIKTKEKAPESYANIMNNLSSVYYDNSEYVLAREYALKAIEISQKDGFDKVLVSAYNNLALVHIMFGELEQAIDLYVKSLKIGEKNGYMMYVANTYSNMANVHYQLLDIEQAQRDLQKAEQISKKLGNEYLLAKIYTNMAILKLQQQKYKEALDLHERAYEIRQEIGSKPEIVNSLLNIGTVYINMNQLDKAEEYYQKCLELSKKIKSDWGIANSYNNLADINIMRGSLNKAWEMLEESKEISQKHNFNGLLRNNLLMSVEYFKKSENYQKALELYTQYEAVRDSLLAEKNVAKITSIRAKYEVDKKTKENEILKKNLQIQDLEKQFLYVLLVAAFLLILFIVIYAISKIKLSRRLEMMNQNLRAANQTVEDQKEEISLINKMLRHDLANNFVVIQTAIQLFLEEENKTVLKEASVKCDNGLKLIRDLREHEYRAVKKHKLDDILIKPLVDDLEEEFSNLKIIYSGDGKVKADKRLASVFHNIIENAQKHGEASIVTITVQDFSEYSEIRISDNGKGISEKVRKHIFKEKFAQGEHANTGMGLHIVKSNILKWGGSIYAEENLPHGATFVINLKRA